MFTSLWPPWTAACQASLSSTVSRSWLILTSIEFVMPSNHLILCCLLIFLPSVFPSIRVCSNEAVLHIGWPKYWSFSFSISPSNEYSGLISFRKSREYKKWILRMCVSVFHNLMSSVRVRTAFVYLWFSSVYPAPRTMLRNGVTERSVEWTDRWMEGWIDGWWVPDRCINEFVSVKWNLLVSVPLHRNYR